MLEPRGEGEVGCRFNHEIKHSHASDSVHILFCLSFSLSFRIVFPFLFVLFFICILSFAYWCIMDGAQGENNSAIDTRVTSVVADVNFGQEYVCRLRRGF